MSRTTLLAACSFLALALAACTRAEADLGERIDRSLQRAGASLIERRDPDGAWRSHTYGNLKDGWALTLPAAKALAFAPSIADARAPVERVLARLVSAVDANGQVDAARLGLGYPVYTASLATILLTRVGDASMLPARDAWLALLKSHQLDEDLGWSRADSSYGGWGYSVLPPRRDTAASSAFEADISSTTFALGALHIAGVPAEDPAMQGARAFVMRCQNWPLEGVADDPRFDDGGFFFTPANEFQNKAGSAGVDASGRERHRSYGSATADGIRSLLALGFARDDPRVLAALRWLAANFTATTNPGEFEGVRAVEREATYFYWCWSAAHALTQLGIASLEREGGLLDWRREIAEAVLARQRPDGTWSNRYTMVKEDDPLVATPLAMGALALCRLGLAFPTAESPR